MRHIKAVIKTFAFSLCFAVGAVNIAAQTATTGTIEGTVLDTMDNAVPGVTVRVASPNLISPQTASTDDEGRYRILNLPPGRYTVTVEATKGFAAFRQENVEVNLSSTSTVAVTLQPEGAQASVTVTDTSGASVDVTSNTTGTNVSTEQFSNFPTQRTVQSLYSIAPTAARSGLRDAAGRERDPSVGGASGPENNYILDGVTTTDPAYGGGGANLPFEFVQEVEIKTGAYGAEYGKATGGIFNVITKSGGNEIRGDAFAYFTSKGMVRQTKNFSNSDASTVGFSEVDAGFDIGGPIKKDKLWFFGAFNPQFRKNFYLGQSLRTPFENQVKTPFYAGKLTYAVNQNNTLTFSTFGDFSTLEGFQVNPTGATDGSFNGFGADPNSFLGTTESGGQNYAARLNSSMTPNWIGEFSFGLHLQRYNRIPTGDYINRPANFDRFSILRTDGTVAPVTQSGIFFGGSTGFVDYAYSPGGTLQRTFFRDGYASILAGKEARNRWEAAAKLQNIWGKHTFKYGFEFVRNSYNIDNRSTGPTVTFGNPLGLALSPGSSLTAEGFRIDRRYFVCTTRTVGGLPTIVCPDANGQARAALIAAQAGFAGGAILSPITLAESQNNPFLIRNVTRVRDYRLIAETTTDTESFYIQDDYKISRDVQINVGVRWDYQQSKGKEGEGFPIRLNNFMDNLQPRVGLIYDFTGKGKGKLFINYARFVETPIPLDVNVRALSDTAQFDNNYNIDRYNPVGGNALPINGFAVFSSGHTASPVDADLRPPSVNEGTVGLEYEIAKDLAIGFRGIYRAQGSVIEDGSFDGGNTYFIFNPGESATERAAQDNLGFGFGRARRYYRALEFTATKRFSNNYQFIASYVYSSLIGNYEGLFRNDNGQADPNITSLFDLPQLLGNSFGRLPNDRPHQFKFDGSYQTRWRLLISGSFRAQSGSPFNQLIPGFPPYGDNEGFNVPRGTAIIPADAPGGIRAGRTRTPTLINLDLGLYYPIALGENRQLRLTADWFNVFNSQRAIRMDETFLIQSGVAGVPDVPNPFYGTGRIFQFPSALRLGVKFSF